MGLARQFALRATLYMFATLLSIAGSLVLVRKLEPEEYAYYQGLTKRAFQIGWLPLAVTIIFLYRWLSARTPRSLALFAFQTLLTIATMAISAASWAWLNKATPMLAVASIALLVLFGVWNSLRLLADAWRPVRVSVSILLTRFAQSLLILLSVYIMAMGLAGAFASVMISSVLGVLYLIAILKRDFIREAYRTLSGLRELVPLGFAEYLKLIRSYPRPVFHSSINIILSGLDVFIATSLKSLAFTAPFLAFQSIMGLLQDTLGWASRVLQRNLITGESSISEVLRTIHLIILLSTPLYLFAAYHPTYIAMLLNPTYAQHPQLLAILSIASLIALVEGITINTVLGIIPINGGKEKEYLTQTLQRLTITYATHTALLTIALTKIDNEATALQTWGLLHLTRALLVIALVTHLMPLQTRRKHITILTKALAKSSLVSITLLYLTSPILPPPHPRFWDTLYGLIPTAVVYLTTYSILIVLVDGEARSALTRLPSLLRSQGRP